VSGRFVTVNVTNDGTGDARDVSVVLQVGGVEVDRALLQRVPSHGSGVATLAAPSGTKGQAEVSIEASLGGEPASVPVSLQSENKTPWGAPVELLGVVAVLAAARRLRRPPLN